MESVRKFTYRSTPCLENLEIASQEADYFQATVESQDLDEEDLPKVREKRSKLRAKVIATFAPFLARELSGETFHYSIRTRYLETLAVLDKLKLKVATH